MILEETVSFLKSKGVESPELGVVLGTGLGRFVELMDIETEVPYSEIPYFPEATVEFHEGRLIQGRVEGVRVIAMQGRYHFYEGYNMRQITYPIRVMRMLGVRSLVLSNAAGAINLNYKKGDLMLIKDHINLLPSNPLLGPNDDLLGPRFPDMSKPYDLRLHKLMMNCAKANQVELGEGAYAAVMGPHLETRAEYRFLKIIGADAVGMSTVPEVIVAKHMGLPCTAVSVLTDICDPENLEKVDIQDIIKNAGIGEAKLMKLLPDFIRQISQLLS